MAEELIVRTIKINVDQAEKSLAKVEGAQDKVTGSTKNLEGGMTQLPGPLGAAQGAVKGLTTAFKALLANPIVLIIAGIVLGLMALYKAFSKTQAGADKISDAMTGLSAVMDVLIERGAKLFKALGQIFKGNFKQGFDEIKGAVNGVGKEMVQAAKDAMKLEEAIRNLYVAETDLLVTNAERQQQIAALVLKTRDMTLSVNERRDAIIEADKLEKAILDENIKLQEKRLYIAKQEMETTPELLRSREQERKIQEETAKLIDLQTNSYNKQRELKNRLITLDNEAAADKKANAAAEAKRAEEIAAKTAAELELEQQKQAEADAIEKERQDNIAKEEKIRTDSLEDYKREKLAESHEGRLVNLASELEQGLILKEEYNLRVLDLEKQNQEEIDKEKKDSAQKQADIDAKTLAQKISDEELLKNVKKKIYQDSLYALTEFLGEGSKAAKGLAIADATRSAIRGAINAYTSTLQLGPVGAILAPIAAGAALAAGMANVRKIAKTPDPVLPGGGGGGGSSSVPSITLAQPASTGVEDIMQTDVGIGRDVNIIQDRTSRNAVKAYVVESEVTAEQDMARQRHAEVEL